MSFTARFAQDAGDAELEVFSFAVDPAGQRDRYPGKGKSINVDIVTNKCFYIKLFFFP
jgi:hypothetical protein